MRCLTILIALTISINFANASEPILGLESYGTVKFGSPILDVEKTLGEKGTRESGEVGCDYIRFKRYPKVSFMVEDGIVTRADVEKGVPNTLKIPVGTSLADVKKKYPKVIVEQHKYDEEGHYLIFKNAKGTKAIVMEEGNGKVTDIRGGLEPSVEYVEGCL
jgi:hypothetical protein